MILTQTNRYGIAQAITLKVWPLLKPLLMGSLRKYRGVSVDVLGRQWQKIFLRKAEHTKYYSGTNFIQRFQFNKMKYSTLFLLGLFLFSCTVAEKKTNEAQKCIDKVIQMDEALGKSRNHACEKIPLSETIHDYVKGLHEINYDNCPEAFSSAFNKHAEAWLKISKVTDNYPELRGEMHDLFAGLEKGKDSLEFKALQKEIWDTWKDIENAMKE